MTSFGDDIALSSAAFVFSSSSANEKNKKVITKNFQS